MRTLLVSIALALWAQDPEGECRDCHQHSDNITAMHHRLVFLRSTRPPIGPSVHPAIRRHSTPACLCWTM